MEALNSELLLSAGPESKHNRGTQGHNSNWHVVTCGRTHAVMKPMMSKDLTAMEDDEFEPKTFLAEISEILEENDED